MGEIPPILVFGCLDSDGDGWADTADALPFDAGETMDSDGDGVGDNADEFPNNAAESKDSDGDGVGDNSDMFPMMPVNPWIRMAMG